MSQSIPTWCWYCKQEIPTVADACPYCGKPLNDATKVVRCGKCGRFLLKNAPRCTQCGEPTPQPEPPAAPTPPPAAVAEPSAAPVEPVEPPAPADTPPAETGGTPDEPSAQGAEAAAETPETLKMFEELELLSARHAQSAASKKASKGHKSSILSVVLLFAVSAGIIFGVWRVRVDRSGRPAYCAENEHRWIEADCTTPKTCAVCGKTEGEPEGHRYVENVCTVCGKYAMLFYFTGSESERSGGEVTFRGNIKNFAETEVQSLQIKLQLYDENKTLVETLSGTTIENANLAPFESTTWQIRYGDSSVKWKYWRVYVSDYSPKA